MLEPAFVPREVCYECDKPASLCVCARVPRLDNRTQVLVLQHPRERAHPIGTARFARLGLANGRVEVAWDAGVREDVVPSWVPAGTALLYPGEGAHDLESMPESERPTNLMVIDGTWHTARALVRNKAWLRTLPQVKLSPASPSRYRIRREPRADYVSTIEAIVHALSVLEPETKGLAGLLAAFDSMIDDQLEHIKLRAGRPRDRKQRPEHERRTPRALVEAFERIVITYVESFRRPDDDAREIVQLVAVSMRTGARFERIVRPSSGPPKPALLRHMRIDEASFSGGCTLAELGADFETFLAACGPDALLAAWNQSTLDLIAAVLGTPPSRLALKSAYRSVYGADVAELRDAVALRGLVLEPGRFQGRAGERHAQALAIARHLHDRATGKLSIS